MTDGTDEAIELLDAVSATLIWHLHMTGPGHTAYQTFNVHLTQDGVRYEGTIRVELWGNDKGRGGAKPAPASPTETVEG